MSLVHYLFPNVSFSGGHKDTVQLSRLFPGPSVDESTTVQHHYFYEPVVDEMRDAAAQRGKEELRGRVRYRLSGIGKVDVAVAARSLLIGAIVLFQPFMAYLVVRYVVF